MQPTSSWKALTTQLVGRLKRARSAFLKWPAWIKGGLLFGSALAVFNVLGASSYMSYRWQLESSQQIPRARDLSSLSSDALAQLQQARQQRQALPGLIAAIAKLKARAAEPGPNQTYDTLAWLSAELSRPSRGAPGAQEEKLAQAQSILQEIKFQQNSLLQSWSEKAKNASRIFGASILFGNLLAFLLISLGGHSLIFHMSLSEASALKLEQMQRMIDAAASAKAFEEKLERDNQSLLHQVEDLSRHSQDMSAFSELTEMLQASSSTAELCRVVTAFAQQLFIQESGTLYLLKDRGLLEPIGAWGEPRPALASFAANDCWALRRAKPHFEKSGNAGLFCAHVQAPLPASSLCLPLIAQGGALGMLHLQDIPGSQVQLSESKQLLAVALAQQIALGLSNLRLRELLTEDSIRDPLTGLYNRRYMAEALEQEISRARRGGGGLGVISFDLDHFKEVNDRGGHAAGDSLLQSMGTLIRECVRSGDIACRLGGDEFLVILPEITASQALGLAEALRAKMQAAEPQGCTLSIGVAMFPRDAGGAESLLLAADRALYRAKSGGRNRVEPALSDGPPA